MTGQHQRAYHCASGAQTPWHCVRDVLPKIKDGEKILIPHGRPKQASLEQEEQTLRGLEHGLRSHYRREEAEIWPTGLVGWLLRVQGKMIAKPGCLRCQGSREGMVAVA